jgi:molybdopterin/thiamine biosynthesis adenylyltransferase
VRIAFCGVGALGSTAVVMSRNVDATLRLIDFDRVESKNLLAQAFVKQSIGKNKADALRLQLSNFYGVKAESFGRRLSNDNCEALLADADLLVDCFDNAASRRLLSDFARSRDKPLVHAAISADGSFGIVRWDERFEADEESEEGQATCEGGEHLPLIGLVAATLARAVQDYLESGEQRDSMVSLNAVNPTSV